MAQLWLGRIYPIEEGDTVLEPNEAPINLMGRIYPTCGWICATWAAATALEPDGGRINLAGRIYPTRGQICLTWQCYHTCVTQ
jgi:hypothetical protein